MNFSGKISRGFIYLSTGSMADLLSVATCGVIIYFGLVHADKLEKTHVIMMTAASVLLIACLALLAYEIPRLGIITRKEDGSVRCKYLVHCGERKMIKIINIKTWWIRKDTRFKINFIDENETARTIIVATKAKYWRTHVLFDMLKPK